MEVRKATHLTINIEELEAKIQEIIFNALNYSCIYSTYNSMSNCTAPYHMREYINMRYSSSKGTISSKPDSAFSASQGGFM